jgi:PAS domain S-box-containing protein
MKFKRITPGVAVLAAAALALVLLWKFFAGDLPGWPVFIDPLGLVLFYLVSAIAGMLLLIGVVLSFARKSEQAKAALNEYEAQLRLITNALPMIIGYVDTELRYRFVNQLYAERLARPPEQIIGQTVAEVLGIEAFNYIEPRMRAALAGDMSSFEEPILFPDGNRRQSEVTYIPDVGEDDVVRGFYILVIDHTDLKRVEEKLRESEMQLRIVCDASPVMISYIDRDRIVRFANRAFATRHGYTPDEIVGKHQSEFWGGDDHQNVNHLIEKTLAGEITTNERQRRHADGTTHTHFTTRAPNIDEDGNVLGYFSVILDLTDQRQAEQQLRQAQKMEAVGQLTGGVAHDFNNLLTVIHGNLELIAGRLEDPAMSRMTRSAIDATKRGAELTQRLLAFSRKQVLSPTAIDLGELLSGMAELMRRTLGATIAVEVVGADGLWRCDADHGQLQSAILNLALNARDAMPQRGSLTIETGNVVLDEADVADQDDVTAGEYVRISVADTGTGMSREVLDHAIEPFFTTKEVGEGSGLGLSMVHGFISQSGGYVTIESEEGTGTAVTFYLPRSSALDEPAHAGPAEKQAVSNGERILVVEDDAEVRAVTVNMLGDLGYDTVEAADGKEALETMRRTPELDLLFTDVVLPGGLSGPDVAREAAKRVPGIKILFTSGYAETVLTRDGDMGDSVQLINKPFRKADLARKLRTLLDEAAL